MEARNWIGIIFLLAGVIIQPIGFMYVFWLQVLSFVLIVIGAVIFTTQKYLDYKVEKEFNSGQGSKAMPGDVHDNSGWGSGGRSESWSSSQGSEGGSD